MLAALEKKALSSSVWANPIKIGQLLDSLGNNVTTDFKTDQLLRLYSLAKKVQVANIKSLSLTLGKYTKNYTTSDGQSALIPEDGLGDYTGLQLYIQQQISDNPVVKEGTTAVVLNGSGVSGLAKKESAALISQGIDVTTYATASSSYASSTIEDNSQGSDPATLNLLNTRYNPVLSSSVTLAKYYGVDFVIILGANYDATN
jgi:hypothetical protein